MDTLRTLVASIAIVGLAGCSKPDVPAEWKDLVPVQGMRNPDDGTGHWVRVMSGRPLSLGKDAKNRAHVLTPGEANGLGSGYDGATALAYYSKDKVTVDALKDAVTEKVKAGGYKLMMTCDGAGAILAAKDQQSVVTVSIDDRTATMADVEIWRGPAKVVGLPDGTACAWTKDAFADDEANGLCHRGHGEMCVLK